MLTSQQRQQPLNGARHLHSRLSSVGQARAARRVTSARRPPPPRRPRGLPGGGAPREVTHEELSASRRAYYSNNHPDIVLPRLGRSGRTRICILNCRATPCHAMPRSYAPPPPPLTWRRGSGAATLTRCHAAHRGSTATAPGGEGRCTGPPSQVVSPSDSNTRRRDTE